MANRIKQAYRRSKNIYDNVLTQNTWWSRLYIRLLWGGVDDWDIANATLNFIPNDFQGELLDVPIGTAVFTYKKYLSLTEAHITGLDYSVHMLEQAQQRLKNIKNVKLIQGDVRDLPFQNESFNLVLSMNGFHAFPEKQKAFSEIRRVLKPNGKFAACFYISGESKITDLWVRHVLSPKGWFTPPFYTIDNLKENLKKYFTLIEISKQGSMVYFLCENR